jgi:hypothetical protein
VKDPNVIEIGTAVAVKDTYCDPSATRAVTGWCEDIFDFDSQTRYVVMFDKDTLKTARENGIPHPPPGGEFSRDMLRPLQ